MGGGKKLRVSVWDNTSDDEDGGDVEENDAPEDLFCGRGDGFAWVGGFSGGEANQLGPS